MEKLAEVSSDLTKVSPLLRQSKRGLLTVAHEGGVAGTSTHLDIMEPGPESCCKSVKHVDDSSITLSNTDADDVNRMVVKWCTNNDCSLKIAEA